MAALPSSGSYSSDYFSEDDPSFLQALEDAVLPGDLKQKATNDGGTDSDGAPPLSQPCLKRHYLPPFEPPPLTQPCLKRKYDLVVPSTKTKQHPAEQGDDAIYGPAHFGNFGEYMQRKRAKLQIQNSEFESERRGHLQGIGNLYTAGVFQPYLIKKATAVLTHILTCSLTPAKLREFKNMKVVRPDWIVKSAQQGILPSLARLRVLCVRTTRWHSRARDKSTASSNWFPDLFRPLPNPQKPPLRPTFPIMHPTHPTLWQSTPWLDRNGEMLHTSVAPDFIEGYYKNSRLHHLSTWKSELKNLVKEAQERAETGNNATRVAMRGAEFVMRSPSKKGKGRAELDERVIMHCDFDCFFVSAGLISRPQLRGKPVVVCSSTSEIASCSYEAREFGIKNGMSLQQARKLCPTIMTIPYEFETFSLRFYTVLMAHADDLQAVSVDEALIDVTSTVNRLRAKAKGVVDPAKELAEIIRAEVKKSTECEISIGISHNILLARLATRRAKPAGSYRLLQDDVAEFMAPLDISSLHGFGYSAKQKVIDKFGVSTLGDLASKSKATLCEVLGKGTGETLYNCSSGKSVSCEINYGIRQMAVEGRSITLKLMKRDPHAPVEAPKAFLSSLGMALATVFNKQGPLADPLVVPLIMRTLLVTTLGECLNRSTLTRKSCAELAFRSRSSSQRMTCLASLNSHHLQWKPPPQKAGPSVPSWDLPSFSQVDKSVYDALPEDVRGELDQEYKRRSESPFVPPPPARYPVPYVRSVVAPSFFPQLKRMPNVNVKRITQQLAPRNRPVYSSNKKKSNFFGKRMGLGTTAKFRMTDDDLRKFDIDPDVFFALPKNVQREQLTRARLLKLEGGIPEVSDEHKSLRPRKRLYSLDGIYRAPPPQARYREGPVLRQRGKEKGEKLSFTEADDIQHIIELWVGQFTKRPPNKKDVEFFSRFLVRSVECDDVGVGRAVAIVKWWLVLLRRNWRDFEHGAVEDREDETWAVAVAWWKTFREVKEEMDVVARRKFGGKLSLR
ncbi:hypothetical protein IW261DRAFT_1503671 [Armillaria novae-zelandiae]|uniref:UmuC domain-containing protein n=1 Tax=Armillaria novae-zelandiae TaxID=153914 RepID=A0AA39NXC2_9AGAR|nr:hypothetical protein IW261DRAFT_1503671 [Armillaria novae-zelandiae]